MIIHVVASVLDTAKLTLYTEDGNTFVIPQGDDRMDSIIQHITPIILAGGVAEVEMEGPNAYSDFEQKSGGLVKFFRVAKSKLSSFFAGKEAPEPEATVLMTITAPQPPSIKVYDAISSIMENAVSVSTPGFSDKDTTSDDTMVAVVNNTVVPQVEKIHTQIRQAAKLGSTIGVTNFMRRAASIIEDRGHTVKELLHHLERCDMQFADDGSIIAYKVLKTLFGKDPTLFYDCHSGKVPQRVGSFVCMDESLIDKNRRNECSTGLHIARRAYLGNFSGNVIVLVKIAPEDVIAVPEYEADKMRVRGYHILFEIPKDQHATLRGNRPITGDMVTSQLLAKAINGNHTAPTSEVRISGPMGSKISTTSLLAGGDDVVVIEDNAPTAKALDHQMQADMVSPVAVSKQVAEARKAVPVVAPVAPKVSAPVATSAIPETRLQKALAIYARTNTGTVIERQTAANELLAFKKAAKVGWDKLGFDTQAVIDDIAHVLALKEEIPVAPVVSNRASQAKAIYKEMTSPQAARNDRRDAANRLLDFKQKAKVSWEKLGLDPTVIDDINNYRS